MGKLAIKSTHRVMCGDSTNAGSVGRLMAGERAGLMNTDPPYGIAYANDDRPNPGVAKPRVAKPRVANDELSDEKLQEFLENAFRAATKEALKNNAAWYLWHAHLTQGYFAAAAAAADVILHRQIIWVKPVLLLGRGHFHWKHEPAFMGWVKGNQPPDYGAGSGERNQTTVWEIGQISIAERKEFNHSSPKPVALFELPIIKHLKKGEIAYEPFSGSGPQIIAAEKTGRRCYAMELSPQYVDVAVKRWQAFTGQAAIREGDGAVFNTLAPAA
jgi:DNA modification methylase